MFKPGESGNTNGRPKGVGNKTTQAIKSAYQKLLEDNLDNMSLWLAKLAQKDEAKAIDLMLRLSEYILPKLARTELAGHDGQDLFQNIKFEFNTANGKKSQGAPQESAETQSENPSGDGTVTIHDAELGSDQDATPSNHL